MARSGVALNSSHLNSFLGSSQDNPFRNARFRRLFVVGAAISWTRWAEIFAFSLIVFELTGSPFSVVLVGLVRMVPLLGGVIIGLIGHKFQARPLIAGSVGLTMTVHALLVPVAIAEGLDVWHLVVAAFVAGVTLAVNFTVRRPLLGSVVAPRLVGRAMSIDVVATTLAMVGSPALTGVFIDAWGFSAVFIWGIAIYGVALIGALGIKSPDRGVLDGAPARRTPIREGYRLALRSPAIMKVIVATTVMNLFVFPFEHFIPVIGSAVLGLTASQVGLLAASEGVGMTIGSVALALWVHPRHFVPTLKGGTALAAAGAIGFGLSTWIPTSIAAVVAVGIGMSGFATMQSAIVVTEAPIELHSPVMGLVGSLIGTNPLGLLLLGAFAALFGPAGGVVTLGSIGFGSTILMGVRTRRRSRT